MGIVKVFATILTVAGMFLLIFSCLAFMQGEGALLGVDIDKWGSLVPFTLGMIFFVAGIVLFKYIVSSVNGGR